MRLDARRILPFLLLLLACAGIVWAVTFEPFEPADFTFINGTEVQSVDPAVVTGVPEGRIINALFEGLLRSLPVEGDPNHLEPQPGLAESYTLSDDGRTYTFTIRDDAWWSHLNADGSVESIRTVTADDFLWSWKRFLTPETASQYAYQLYYVKNGRKYSSGASQLEPGDRVEIELYDRPNPGQQYPSGTILPGVLIETIPAKPDLAADEEVSEEERQAKLSEWLDSCIWVVEVKPEVDGEVSWDQPGVEKRFYVGSDAAPENTERCHGVLLNFSEVGIRAPDEHTFVVELENPTGYFDDLCAFYPMYPVNRECVEKYGVPDWTKAENIVCSGPFLLEFRRIRDRIRLVRNPSYWNAETVSLETVDALPVADTTGFNMYMDGQADWTTTVPSAILPDVIADPDLQDDLKIAPLLGTYFYRFNTTRPPLNDPRVRRALNMSVDKAQICEYITRAGQIPAQNFVPELEGYQSAGGDAYDPEAAKKLLEEAIADGVEMRKLELLTNSGAGHNQIALTIANQWREHLGIQVETREIEWGVMLNEVRQENYDVARAGWIGDYPDPNTFLDMFVTGGENNETGWSNARYDDCIRLAGREADPQRRMALLTEAEGILNREMPVMPIYFYVSVNLVRPYVRGFNTNIQDLHPLQLIQIDQKQRSRAPEGDDR